MSENIKRVEFDMKHINNWSLDKITQKRHEKINIVIENEKLNEITSNEIQKMLIKNHEIVIRLDFLFYHDA